jgi:hypothetical protein
MKKKLTPKQIDELIDTLKTRFEKTSLDIKGLYGKE